MSLPLPIYVLGYERISLGDHEGMPIEAGPYYQQVAAEIMTEKQQYILNYASGNATDVIKYVTTTLTPFFTGLLEMMKVRSNIEPRIVYSGKLVSIHLITFGKINAAWSNYSKTEITSDGKFAANYLKDGAWDRFLQIYLLAMNEYNTELIKFKQQAPGTPMKCSICSSKASFKCGSCYKALYCGAMCQRRDWEKHQEKCK